MSVYILDSFNEEIFIPKHCQFLFKSLLQKAVLPEKMTKKNRLKLACRIFQYKF
jgi:hypothetical protein